MWAETQLTAAWSRPAERARAGTWAQDLAPIIERTIVSDPLVQLREHGVALLPGAVAPEALGTLSEAAAACFAAIDAGQALPECRHFNRFSHSMLLAALLDFGCGGSQQLLAPLTESGVGRFASEVMECDVTCRLEESWVRRKHAPRHAPKEHHPQDWHQDGALGVRFPLEAGIAPRITRLITCWFPLNPCGKDAPGLEFIRRRQDALLHFTELNDATLRQRFAGDDFWAPVLELGDMLVILNGTLHRTHLQPDMERDRVSIEYRLFP